MVRRWRYIWFLQCKRTGAFHISKLHTHTHTHILCDNSVIIRMQQGCCYWWWWWCWQEKWGRFCQIRKKGNSLNLHTYTWLTYTLCWSRKCVGWYLFKLFRWRKSEYDSQLLLLLLPELDSCWATWSRFKGSIIIVITVYSIMRGYEGRVSTPKHSFTVIVVVIIILWLHKCYSKSITSCKWKRISWMMMMELQ